MSTTFKGDSFEKQVFKYLEAALAHGNLYVQPKSSQIFQIKGYYSKARGSNIITDISIETSIPDATSYSILTVVECKDYSSNIPVNDIEEFHSKVQQIAGNNVKAIFVTTAALQKAALAYARSKKIAVIRFLPKNQVQWVIYHMTPDMLKKQSTLNISEFNDAFLNQDHIGNNRSSYGFAGDKIYDTLHDLLKDFLNQE